VVVEIDHQEDQVVVMEVAMVVAKVAKEADKEVNIQTKNSKRIDPFDRHT
jgi:hypothetical protein